jgi:hypothetical protein
MKFSVFFKSFLSISIIFINPILSLGQCPDGAALTANDKCIFLTWDPVPATIPTPIVYDGVTYNFQNLGTGAVGNPAIYRNTTPGDPNCSSNDSQVFTGVISIGGNPCGYVNGILPLNLLSFEGKASQNAIVLNWKTSLEVNTSHFDIERSISGQQFEKIATINTKNNNSLEVNNYSYSDLSVPNKLSYYRLKINDLDGKSSISKIISVLPKSKTELMINYPNPSQNWVKFNLTDKSLIGKSAKIYSSTGKLMIVSNITSLNMEMDISALQPAVYFVKFTNGETLKILKK